MFGASLADYNNGDDLNVDSGNNFGVAIAWQDSPNGQGQITLSQVSHQYESSENTDEDLDIMYAHFNGVAQFRQKSYVSTVSLGLGGAYFKHDKNSEVYPSATLAFGTRYEFSKNLAFVTEIRGYASLVDDEDELFCVEDICSANFDDSLWIESNISVGFAYKF